MTGGRLAAVLVAATVLVGAVAAAAVGVRPAAHARASGPDHRRAAALDPVDRAARAFLSRYEQPDGQVVRWDQGADTVSEGQAYAMLVAVGVGDRTRFAAAWEWSRSHLLQGQGLLSWHYAGGRAVDPTPSADADVDAAWALGLAARRFSSPAYDREAAVLAAAVLAHEVEAVGGRPVLLPGPWAAGPAPLVDPSYLGPLGLQALADLGQGTGPPSGGHGTGKASTGPGQPVGWGDVLAGSRALLGQLMAGGRLPPDWARVTADGWAQPAGPPSGPDQPPSYGFDAVRLPVRLAASCDRSDLALAAGMWRDLAAPLAAGAPLVQLDLGGSPLPGAPDAPVGLVGAAGAAAAAGHHRLAGQLLARAEEANRRYPTYYGSAWVALGRLLLQTPRLGGCPPLKP